MAQLSEAEVLGDDVAVRHILSLLRSREEIPAKVFIFREDTRPGYFGTFTKSSSVVGPRTPFAKDAVAFDYSYDSGEEWEEEGAGDDLMSADGSGDEVDSDADSELDDWLVDDDDEIADPGTPLSERLASPNITGPPPPKRKVAPTATDAAAEKKLKKRKVVPLVAFTKGPCWENTIGHCEYEPFGSYRIHLLNGTYVLTVYRVRY